MNDSETASRYSRPARMPDDHCGELSRIAAISICGRLGAQDARPVLENLAQRGASVPLRTTAIAALGDIGAVEASGLLRRLLIEGNPRLQPALQRALGQLVKN